MEQKQTTIKEKARTSQRKRNYFVNADKYILVHIDGRSFSKNVKSKFKKPFDDDFINMMDETAIYLCENVQGAKIAYVQSDEITLLLKKNSPEGDIFFGGRLCKMQSIIAALATAKFNQLMVVYNLNKTEEDWRAETYTMPFVKESIKKMPLYQFDCKVWDVDTPNDAFTWFLYRNIDCVKNSKQAAAQTWIPHKELVGKQTDEQIELLKEREGIDWNDFSQGQKYGRFIDKTYVEEETVTPQGEVVHYTRSKWFARPGLNLTNEEQRKIFINYYDFFKKS